METTLYLELLHAVWREILGLKIKLFFLCGFLTFSILTVGYLWPEKYETSTALYADVTNIIKPLLEGTAEVTTLDLSKKAADIIYTRKILTKVAESAGLMSSMDPPATQRQVIKNLRRTISVQSEGQSYFRITYFNENQDLSFKVLNIVVDEFIRNSVDSRRTESRNAYEFIDQQVISYKNQLILAERNLKDFKSKNLDGNENTVNARINQLRLAIEEIKLTIDETESKESSLKRQLKNEGKLQKNRSQIEDQEERLESLRSQLDIYRLSYQETYPDIVAIKEQISAIELVIEAMSDEGYVASSSSSDNLENPLYEELRRRQAEIEVDLRSQRRRLSSMKKMLEDEYLRAQRVASHEAELSELVRDYDVTREIYEEMLGRKEKARLSMTLDVEGQGVSFKIQEPAVYPLNPSGLHFIHFAVLGPFIALFSVIGLMILYVLVDPRLRSPMQLVQSLPENIQLLGVIPHINSPVISRLQKADMLIIILGSIVFLATYAALVFWNISGAL